MKKTIIPKFFISFLVCIASLIFCVSFASGLTECDSPLEPFDIPCNFFSTYQFDTACSDNTVNIFDETPTLLEIRTYDDYGITGRCNITFNYSERGSYLLNSSEGSSATIIVRGVKMEFLNLTIFGLIFLIGLTLIAFMHKFKEDEGSSIVYGFFATALYVLLAGSIFFGFQPIASVSITAPFNINNMLGLICLIFGLYSGWYSVALWQFMKREKEDEEDRDNFLPR